MNVLHLFAGAGGSHLAGQMLGWDSAGSVEIEPYCQAVLRHHFPDEDIHGDIRTFSASHLAGKVDGVCGGFPCQDISSAGKGAGIAGERSGLWKEFARIIGGAKPRWAFIENSPLLRTRGLEVILEDLAALGYDAEWATYLASDVGAPHRRDRMWIFAYSNGAGQQPSTWGGQDARHVEGYDPWGLGTAGGNPMQDRPQDDHGPSAEAWAAWLDLRGLPQPCFRRVVDGMAHRVDRIACLGNGWVPQQAAEAFRQLWNRALTP